MKTLKEQREAAIRVINNIITLTANVSNGCPTSQETLDEEFPRLFSIKKWAAENNQIQEIEHYFASQNFGQNNQFAAAEISEIFINA